jgi:nucleoside-diphosphate-sugar epimerase
MIETVLVTGSRGVIGRQLVKILESRDIKVIGTRRRSQAIGTSLEVELSPWSKIEIEKHKIDAIVHLAGVYITKDDPTLKQECFNVNIGLAESVAALQRTLKIPVVAVGSFFEKNPGPPWSYYSISKSASREILRSAAVESQGKLAYVYLYDSYSEDVNRGKFIDLLLKSALSEVPLDASPGNQVQDLTYVSDIARGLLQTLKNVENQEDHFLEAQIRSGQTLTLREVSSKVREFKKDWPDVNWGIYPYRDREVFEIWDCAPNVEGWKPSMSLEKFLPIYFKGIDNDK